MKSVLAIGIIGNIVEEYCVTVFCFLTPFIAIHFLPTHNHDFELFYIYGFMVISNLLAPIGALCFGLLADKKGRKISLVLSIILTGIMSCCIGLIPNYSEYGIYTLVLLVGVRLLQGLTYAGEHTSSLAWLIEHSPPTRRGFYCSFATLGGHLGVLLASLICGVIGHLINTGYLNSAYWRLPFFITGIGAIIGGWMRREISESLDFYLTDNAQRPYKQILAESFASIRENWRSVLICLLLTWCAAVTFSLVFIYGPIHMTRYNHLSFFESRMVNAIAMLVMVLFGPAFGHVSDIKGRGKYLIISTLLLVLWSLPYYWDASYGSFVHVVAVQVIIAIPASCFLSIASTVVMELLPIKVRCTKGAIAYTLPAAVFGGTAPLIAIGLIKLTGETLAPVYYMIFSAFIGFLGACKIYQAEQASFKKKVYDFVTIRNSKQIKNANLYQIGQK